VGEGSGQVDDRRLSQRAVRSISICIVLSALLIVTFFVWDRHMKKRRQGSHGSPSWRHHGPPEGIPLTATSDQTSTPIPIPASMASRPPTIDNPRSRTPPIPRPTRPMIPARTRAYSDNTSPRYGLPPRAPTYPESPMDDSTDITDSDGNGSDLGGVPALPRISDERYVAVVCSCVFSGAENSHSFLAVFSFQSEGQPLSPLHIPDEESDQAVDLANMISPPASPTPMMLGLGDTSPTMTGFQMNVTELE